MLRKLLVPTELLGCLDFIGPSLVSGWALHCNRPVQQVRLTAGGHLLAAAPCTQQRPDVAAEQGGDGQVGFVLTIDEQLPLVRFDGPHALVAFDADGNRLGEVCHGQGEGISRRLLAAALDPALRGRVGHCDGFAAEGACLTGWAHQGRRGPCGIWLQRPGHSPIPVACDQPRADILRQGQALACGFRVAWPEPGSPEAAGLRLTFDPQGLLPLPGQG